MDLDLLTCPTLQLAEAGHLHYSLIFNIYWTSVCHTLYSPGVGQVPFPPWAHTELQYNTVSVTGET